MTMSPPRGNGGDPPSQRERARLASSPNVPSSGSRSLSLGNVDVVEQKRLHLEALEARRDRERALLASKWSECKALKLRVESLQEEMKNVEASLMEIDDDIDRLQEEIDSPPQEEEEEDDGPNEGEANAMAGERNEEKEEFVFHDELDADGDDDFPPPRPSKRRAAAAVVARSGGEQGSASAPFVGLLELLTNEAAAPTATGVSRARSDDSDDRDSENRHHNAKPVPDCFLPCNAGRKAPKKNKASEHKFSSFLDRPPPRPTNADPSDSRTGVAFSADPGPQHEQPPPPEPLYPWSDSVHRLLRGTFRLSSFRDSQLGIINATLSGHDAFVVMRTGGGKSLTYQLPALLEGRSPPHKVTFVVSPLLSLIQDQEEQMNQVAPGSAVSFSSSIGTSEHARRWGLVRDPTSGVCLVFVTPEKVSQSKKMQTEMEKLSHQGRLGRFVVDECHCASQWGHDFRPDYTKLGLLKRHFPHVPCIAVTATASDKVRDDVTDILCLDRNYRFFRSSANRPNLRYSVRAKRDGGKDVVQDMVAFIKDQHPRNAGIVYTFSRKDADTVASQLCEYGVSARSYHSDVPAKTKERIHRSWMRNETQVVVATIAFGLGINKPDVRFVLHHSLSKTLDAYYQESGRAGRNGSPADCVLYYSPKDVPRMLKMVHGTKGEALLWPMVRYAQASSDDAVCRAILMRHLGEPVVEDMESLLRRYDGTHTERREVGRHCQTAAKLLAQNQELGEKMTMPMLIKEWRSKSKSSPKCVLDFPPSKDGLTADECERIVISMLLESVFEPKIVWGAYDSIVYLELGRRGWNLVQSTNPTICIRFPIVDDSKPSAQETQKKSRRTAMGDGGWVKTKATTSIATSRKTKPVAKRPSKAKTVRVSKTSKPGRSKKPPKKAAVASAPEVIDILSSDDDGDSDDPPLRPRKPASEPETRGHALYSTSEEEF